MNMNQNLRNAAAALVAAAVLSTMTAFAGPTIDKGDLGKYERQGRFVKKVATPVERPSSGAAVKETGAVTYDKGELGSYVREGRFVWRVPQENSKNAERIANGAGFSERDYRVVKHQKHVHNY